jgi:hypothetical protein
MRVAIVTGADASFFGLLSELIDSYEAAGGRESAELCAFDLGLTSEQVQIISPRVARVVQPRWDYPFGNAQVPGWFAALTARPHLPTYFDHDIILWVDADAWFCNWEAAALLIRAAQTHELVAVPELDRAYAHCFGLRPQVAANLLDTYREAFGDVAAQRFAHLPVVNAGVFAMHRDSPGWKIWGDLLGQALQRSTRRLVEQCALNVALYTGRIRPHFLPSWCNWNCGGALPWLNPATRQLLAPMLPNEVISICHLMDVKMQAVEVQCTDGRRRSMALTYGSVRGAGVL